MMQGWGVGWRGGTEQNGKRVHGHGQQGGGCWGGRKNIRGLKENVKNTTKIKKKCDIRI